MDPGKLRKSFALLGFDGYCYSEVQGYVDGICVGWKRSVVTIRVIHRDFQFIHLSVEFGMADRWYFTHVYASPRDDLRRQLWESLKIIVDGMIGQWMLAGDFNDIASVAEKKGGALASQRKCDLFMERMDDCQLMDLGAVGTHFTWRGPLFNGLERVFERLDRALRNSSWRLRFSEAYVKVLPRVDFLDHHPLVIYLFGSVVVGVPRIFRFENAWLTHEGYTEFLKMNWEQHG